MRTQKGKTERVDVVGPVWNTADTFARDIPLGSLNAGDLLAIRSAGAYGFVMSSTYNARPRAAEVMVNGKTATLVRRRERLADLWRGETRLDGTPLDETSPVRMTRCAARLTSEAPNQKDRA